MISVPPKGDSEKRMNSYFTPLKVEAQTSPDMTVKISAGSFWTALGEHREFPGGNSPQISPPTSDAKWVVISLTENGLINVLNGAASPNPELPTIPETQLPLAAIFVGDTTTAITNDMVFDIRPLWTIRPENIPNLQQELNNRPTITDVNSLLAQKADVDGTTSATFTLNKNQVGISSTDVELVVERGAEPNVSIRWNETAQQWEFSNDGVTWGPIGMSAGVFYTKSELDSGALDHRYYEKSVLDNGVLDSRYYTQTQADSTFAQLVHAHTAADIANFATEVESVVPVKSVAGKTGHVALVEADITDLDKYSTVPTATVGNLVQFGPSNTLEDTSIAASSVALQGHTHTVSDITDFSTGVVGVINVSSINELSDVVSGGTGDGQVLVFNSVSGVYENKHLPLNDIDGVDIVGGLPLSTGDVLIYNGSQFINRPLVQTDISDYTPGDFVSARGGVVEDITGKKTFKDGVIIENGLEITGPDTKIHTTQLTVSDPYIDINFGETGAGVGGGTGSAGFRIDRGTENPAVLQWNEGSQQWEVGIQGVLVEKILTGTHNHVAAAITDFAPAVTAELNANLLKEMSDVDYPTNPVVGEFLQYDGSNWIPHVAVSADISDFSSSVTAELNVNTLDQIADVTYSTAPTDKQVLIWEGTTNNRWENRLLTKSDISDFNENDYVHVTGDETIAGIKTFSNDVVVNGNLTVNGTTTTVDSSNVAIADNIIELNKGETGAGVTLGTAGISIDRGTEVAVQLYWDEATQTWRAHHNPGTGIVVSDVSFEGHQHVLADVTDVTVNAADVNTLVGIDTNTTVQAQLNDKISRQGDSMDAGANLTFSGLGEVLGLPATPSATAATSKEYVDAQDNAITTSLTTHINDNAVHITADQNTFLDGLNLPTLTSTEVNQLVGVTGNVQTQLNDKISRQGDSMATNANLTFSGGEVLGLPATPSATAATSKEYVDGEITTVTNSLTTHISDAAVHLTADQNTFLDGLNLPTLTSTEVNQLVGVTGNVQTQLNGKANLVGSATAGNLASLTGTGDLADSGLSLNDTGTSATELWSANKISTELGNKADKVTAAVAGNFASLDASGNLVDSGATTSTFAPAVHTHTSADVTDFNTAVDARIANAVLDNLSDVSAPTPTTGDLLQYDGGTWQNRAPSAIVEFLHTQGSVAESITGVKSFVDDVNVGGNVVISGDLTVNGTTTTVSTVNLDVSDKNILINAGYTGSPAGADGSGLEVERGTGTNAFLTWNETSQRWQGGISGSEVTFAQEGVTVAQPDYELQAGKGAVDPVYTLAGSLPAPAAGKAALQVFVNGLKQVEGSSKAYTVTAYSPNVQVTFNAGHEPAVGDDVEFYSFGYIT